MGLIIVPYFFYAALTSLACASTPDFCSEYDCYSPGPQVKRWQQGNFTGREDATGYARTIITRAVALAIVAALLIMGLLCWSCCRCCCNKCRIKHVAKKRTCKQVLVTCTLVLVVVCFGLLIAGLDMDGRQSTAIQSVGGTIDTFISWQPEITAITASLKAAAAEAKSRATALNTVDNSNGDNLDDTAFGILDAQLDAIVTATEEIENQVEAVDFSDFSDDLANQLESADKSRSAGVRGVLATLLVVLLLQASVGLLNAWNKCCVPKHIKACYCCLNPFLSILSTILMTLSWVLAIVLLVLMTAMADFCFTADANILDIGGNDTTLRYFILCDHDPNINNPLRTYGNDLRNSVNLVVGGTAFGHIEGEYETLCPNAAAFGSSPCSNLQAPFNALQAALNNISAQVGSDSDNDGFADTGLTALIECPALNRRYQSVTILVCRDLAEALGSTLQVMLGFAVLYFVVEVFNRLLSDFGRTEKDEDGPDGPMLASNKIKPQVTVTSPPMQAPATHVQTDYSNPAFPPQQQGLQTGFPQPPQDAASYA